MEECKCNESIGCSVTECKYHAQDDQYCSLEKIKIGAHAENPTKEEYVDCKSFSVK